MVFESVGVEVIHTTSVGHVIDTATQANVFAALGPVRAQQQFDHTLRQVEGQGQRELVSPGVGEGVPLVIVSTLQAAKREMVIEVTGMVAGFKCDAAIVATVQQAAGTYSNLSHASTQH